MSLATLLTAIAMPFFIAMGVSIASALVSITHFILTPAKRALKTTNTTHAVSFALGGLVNTVTVAVDTQPDAAPPPSAAPTQVPQQHAQLARKAACETLPVVSVVSVANAKMKRVARKTRALECGKVPGVVDLPIRGMQCAVM
jgi:hypothetical protein